MTLVRERRHQQALRLSLPPPPLPSVHFNHRAHRLASLSLPTSPESPAIDNLSDLEKLAVLGRGNGGTVYKARHKHLDSILALKVLRFDQDAAALRQQAVREAEILKLVDSPYIVRCHAVLNSGDDLCFVMEHMEKGSLHDVLLVVKALSENAISAVARQVLLGLQYLHSMQIVHGDIKPSNLLINMNDEVKIADFGASRRVVVGKGDAAYTNENNYMGTFAYMSPERFDSEAWSGDESADGFAGDVWSLGVVILECLVGRYPLIALGEKPDWAALVCAICFGESLEMPNNASEEFRSFVSRCLEKDWRKRGSIDELLHHPFVNSNSCCGGGSTPGFVGFGLQG